MTAMTTPRIVRTFKPQFAPLVEAGTKLQTVRRTPKRMPQPGWLIDCRTWTGLPYRSKQRQLLVGEITRVSRIEIASDHYIWERPEFSGLVRCEDDPRNDDFAKADGFGSWAEMVDWFRAQHGLPFNGILIQWRR